MGVEQKTNALSVSNSGDRPPGRGPRGGIVPALRPKFLLFYYEYVSLLAQRLVPSAMSIKMVMQSL